MWFFRIINSFLGIRKKDELKNDLNNLNLFKIIIFFLSINIIFISIVVLITKCFLINE